MNIDDLPFEVISKIFSYLCLGDLIAVKQVSSCWNDIVTNSSLWNELNVVYEFAKTDLHDLIDKVCIIGDLVRNVTIKGVDFGANINILLSKCPNMTTLNMVMCRVEESTLRKIETMTNLVNLKIRNCYLSTDVKLPSESNINFSSLKNLRKLHLSDFGLTDENFDNFYGCENITDLEIQKIKYVSQDNMIKFLIRNKNKLLTLCVYGGETYNDVFMEYVADCYKLQTLSINRCENLTDKGLLCIKRINPTNLLLWNNKNFTEKGLYESFDMEKRSTLQYISFSKIQNITEKILILLAKRCPRIKFVGLYMCPALKPCAEKNLTALFRYSELFYG